MGEIADQLVEQMIWGGGFSRPRKRSFQSGAGDFMWRSANGVISMKSMSDEHLRNAIRICEAKGNTGKLRQLQKVLYDRESLIE